MRFVGLDVHKREIQAAVVDATGELRSTMRFATSREAIEQFATRVLERDDQVALEATLNTWAVVRVLRPHVDRVVVSNPLRTRAIAEAKVKTDKVDALVLAQLLRCDYLPTVWQPDERTERMRSMTSRRTSLVSDRTGVKNRIHAVLHQRMLVAPMQDLFGTKGRAWLSELELDELGRTAIDSELRLLDAIEGEIDRLHERIATLGYDDPRVRLLMTLPGVDVAAAQTVLAALGDVTRFRDADHAAAYLGLVPSTRQSADHCYHGPITKRGSSHARWMLVQAAQHVGSHPGPLGVFFRRLKKKKNHNVAVVAAARKLVVIAWHMLKNNEPYRYAIPRSTQSKLGKLRVLATKQKKRGGNAKGAPRPAAYGTGQPSRGVPSLDQLYADEGLPPIAPLRTAEQRALSDAGVTAFARGVRVPRRIPKNTKTEAEPKP